MEVNGYVSTLEVVLRKHRLFCRFSADGKPKRIKSRRFQTIMH